MKININNKINIIVVLVLSLLLTYFLGNNLFIAGTPKINNKFLANINLSGIFANKTKNTGENIVVFKPIEKGVYAADDGNNKYLQIEEDEVDWVVIEITTDNGVKKIKLSKKDSMNQKIIEDLKKIL